MNLRRRSLDDLDEDIRDHIERETTDNIGRGMTSREARDAALRKFGNVALAKEDARAVWIPVWFDQLLQDAHLRNVLVVAQVAVSLVLLVAAGLFVRSLASAERMDLGFIADGVLNVHMDVSQLGYDEGRGRALYRDISRRLAALPGVDSFAFAFSTPMGYYSSSDSIDVEGRPTNKDQRIQAGWNAVEPSYFRLLGVSIQRGRGFNDADDERARPVAIVNEQMARTLWPGEEPIGRHFSFKGPKGPWLEVVGTVKTGKYGYLFENPRAYFYLSLAQEYTSLRVLHVRPLVASEFLATAIAKEIHAIAPDLALFDVQSLSRSLGGGNGFFLIRMGAIFSAALGLLGLLLAVIGVYGVVSYVASQRIQEIGIRMALGASPSDILRLMSKNGIVLVAVGLGVGLLAALALTRFMGKFLFGISAQDPLTFAGVAPILGAVAVLACLVPAWRAARVDPSVALRNS